MTIATSGMRRRYAASACSGTHTSKTQSELVVVKRDIGEPVIENVAR